MIICVILLMFYTIQAEYISNYFVTDLNCRPTTRNVTSFKENTAESQLHCLALCCSDKRCDQVIYYNKTCLCYKTDEHVCFNYNAELSNIVYRRQQNNDRQTASATLKTSSTTPPVTSPTGPGSSVTSSVTSSSSLTTTSQKPPLTLSTSSSAPSASDQSASTVDTATTEIGLTPEPIPTAEGLTCIHGTYNTMDGECECDKAYTGDWCQTHVTDCEDAIQDFQSAQDQSVFFIQPQNNTAPFEVGCEIGMVTVGPFLRYTYIHRNYREDDSFLNKTWLDLKQGFGEFTSDYWLGLDKINKLTSSNDYTLTVTFKYKKYFVIPGTTSTFSVDVVDRVDFINFRVGDTATNYRLTYTDRKVHSYGTEKPTFGLPPYYMAKDSSFSSFDKDTDSNPSLNCALVNDMGFWFDGTCHQSDVYKKFLIKSMKLTRFKSNATTNSTIR